MNDTQPASGVSVSCLIDAWREMEVVQARVAFAQWSQEQAIGTTIDIAQSPNLLDGTAQEKDPHVTVPFHQDSGTAPQIEVVRNHGKHAWQQWKRQAMFVAKYFSATGMAEDISCVARRFPLQEFMGKTAQT
jgi:hypothetical protein